MRTADWTELDPDATYYGLHMPETGWVGDCKLPLGEAQTSTGIMRTYATVVVAYVNGEHVRVPDGDPPARPSLVELQRASDQAELAWLLGDVSPEATTAYALHLNHRASFLHARLAGEQQ